MRGAKKMSDNKGSKKRAPTQRYLKRQSRILEEAVDLLNSKGIAGMTLGDVAARLNLVSTAVMYYYKNKEILAAACLNSGVERYLDIIASTASYRGAERLQVLIEKLFDLNQQIAEGTAPALPSYNEARSLDDADFDARWVGLFKSFRSVVNGAAKVQLEAIDRNVRTHQLITQTLWANYWLMRHEPETFPRLSRQFFNILTEGFLSDHTDWRPPEGLDPDVELSVGDESKEQFLRAATILMNAKGYKGASIDLIAAHLNVTKGAFYHHYETKDDLVRACFKRTFELMRQAQRVGEAIGKTGAERVIIAMTLLVQHQLAAGVPLLRISASASMSIDERTLMFQQFNKFTLRFSGMISDGIMDGSIRPIDPHVAALVVTGTLTSAVEARFWAKDLNAENAAQSFIRPVALGILS